MSYLVVLTILSFFSTIASAQNEKKIASQIEQLLAEKNSRTPVQAKIDSRLLQAVREKRGQKMTPGVDLEPADVGADKGGNLPVDISADVTDTLLKAIETLGGKIIFPSKEYHTVRAEVNLSVIERIAAFKEVKFIGPAIDAATVSPVKTVTNHDNTGPKPATISPKNKLPAVKKKKIAFEVRARNVRNQLTGYLNSLGAKSFIGSVNSQGDRAHRADDARATYGYTGQGIRIGVLSDSYNVTGGATSDVLNGNLPGKGNPLGHTTPVTVVADYTSGADEGRAMLQIVHDIAPKAQLFFATALLIGGITISLGLLLKRAAR